MAKLEVRGLVEIVGLVAVLLGLVFVGLELRQNTAALSAQAVFELNDSSNENHRAVAQDPELALLVSKGYADPTTLSNLELERFVRWMRVRFNLAEAGWLYHRQGLIDDGEFAGIKGSICMDLKKQGAKWFWNNSLGRYASGFTDDVTRWCLTE